MLTLNHPLETYAPSPPRRPPKYSSWARLLGGKAWPQLSFSPKENLTQFLHFLPYKSGTSKNLHLGSQLLPKRTSSLKKRLYGEKDGYWDIWTPDLELNKLSPSHIFILIIIFWYQRFFFNCYNSGPMKKLWGNTFLLCKCLPLLIHIVLPEKHLLSVMLSLGNNESQLVFFFFQFFFFQQKREILGMFFPL